MHFYESAPLSADADDFAVPVLAVPDVRIRVRASQSRFEFVFVLGAAAAVWPFGASRSDKGLTPPLGPVNKTALILIPHRFHST